MLSNPARALDGSLVSRGAAKHDWRNSVSPVLAVAIQMANAVHADFAAHGADSRSMQSSC